MKNTSHLGALADDIYRDAKALRLLGVLCLTASGTAAAILLSQDHLEWNLLTGLLTMISGGGFVAYIVGQRQIRKVKKHTGVDVPYI